jgi:hypothetical protein
MTPPRKLYNIVLKSRIKSPRRKFVDAPTTEVRPDMLEAVRRAVAENRKVVEQPTQR